MGLISRGITSGPECLRKEKCREVLERGQEWEIKTGRYSSQQIKMGLESRGITSGPERCWKEEYQEVLSKEGSVSTRIERVPVIKVWENLPVKKHTCRFLSMGGCGKIHWSRDRG